MIQIAVICFLAVFIVMEKVMHVRELKQRDEREERLFDRLLGKTEEPKRINEDKPKKVNHGKHPFEKLKKDNTN